jgi:hypothetical protein
MTDYLDPSTYLGATGGMSPAPAAADPSAAYAAALGGAPQNYISDYASAPHLDVDRSQVPGTPEYMMAHPGSATDLATQNAVANTQFDTAQRSPQAGQLIRESLANLPPRIVAPDAAKGPTVAGATTTPAPPDAAGPAGMALRMATGGLAPQHHLGGGNRYQGELDRAVADQQKAILAGAAAGASAAAEKATYQSQLAESLDKQQADQLQRDNQRQAIYDTKLRDLDKAQADFAKISTTVDPHRFFADKGTGARVLAGLGIFLSGLGGQGQQALQQVQTAIDRDIDAQKATIQGNLDKGRQAVSSKVTMLGIYRDKFKDDAAAEAATRATMLEGAAARMDAMAQKYAPEQIKAKAMEGAAQLRAAAAQEKQRFAQSAQELAIKQQLADQEGEKMKLTLMEKMMTQKGANNELLVPGLGLALDKKAAELLREKKTSYENAQSAVDELLAMRNKNGAEFTGAEVGKMRSAANRLLLKYQKHEGLTRLSDVDVKILGEIAGGDPTRIGYVAPVLQDLRKSINTDFMNEAHNYLAPGQAQQPGGNNYGGVPLSR